MGLYLNRDKSGGYRRAWYAKISEGGRMTGRRLKTPLRGKIPLDASGAFSLDLTGDASFEKSKADAKAELAALLDKAREMSAEERNAPGYIEREVYRKTTGRKFEVVAIADLADRNAERTRYALTGDRVKDGHRAKVYNILAQFSAWCAAYNADKPRRNRLKTIADITAEVAARYYADIAKPYTWETFRACVFTLASVFRYFMPDVVENPFAKAYEDNYKGHVKGLDKSRVQHEAPTPEQVHRIWDCAANMEQYPYLRRLAVLAACSGMRIGDCCRLTWDKVDLRGWRIETATAKTGAKVSIPVFDHDPDAPDYHEMLGELRRELEAAILEREDGEKHVIPEAAAVYAKDPDRITKIGKKLFARALFADTEPEDAQLVENTAPALRPVDVLRIIENADIAPAKKSRLMRTYELRTHGKTYSQIAAATGGRKGIVSQDLAEVEALTGERIRPGAHTGTTLRDALRRTRQTRTQGTKSGCRYGWHSFRVFFVVTAIQAGIDPGELKRVTGHSTVNMVLHYYNPEERIAAEKMRQSMSRRRLARTPIEAQGTGSAALLPPQGEDVPRTELGAIGAPPQKTAAERLQEAKALLDAGLITPDEFAAKRAEIIAAL